MKFTKKKKFINVNVLSKLYLSTDGTESCVYLDVNPQVSLPLLLVLGLDVNSLHLGVDNVDVVKLESGVAAGYRADRDRVQEIHCNGGDASPPSHTRSIIEIYTTFLHLQRTASKINVGYERGPTYSIFELSRVRCTYGAKF